MFMLAMRSMVESKSNPWNMLWWKCRCRARSSSACECSRCTYSAAATRKPAVPQAGSQISSPRPGFIISTISWMMCRGVRNWPFCPAVAILPSMYSYRSPLTSPRSSGSSFSASTAFTRRFGVGMVNRASFMWWE
jgi:hypothetical protein